MDGTCPKKEVWLNIRDGKAYRYTIPHADANQLNPASVISALASILLPKLYAMAAMWTLNTREAIRTAVTNDRRVSADFETTLGAGLEWAAVPRPTDVQSIQTLTEGENSQKNAQ
ncbi:hypothetical protein K438DRAFT_1754259 [Mycena galopus ATCC 62051]|nr:hypothetical protein K438DRAFT_1754259 [Mycena galopus ATCC 62051]